MSKVSVPSDLMTYQETADYLHMTLQSVRTAVDEGRLHSVKIPGIVHKFIKRADVMAYHDRARSTEAPTEAPQALAQLSPDEMRAYMAAFAAPIESLGKGVAAAAAQAAMQEAIPGALTAMLSGLQILRGQQPTLDPKALAV